MNKKRSNMKLFKIKLNNKLSDNNYCLDQARKIALDFRTMFTDVTVDIVEVSDNTNNK